MLYNKLNIYNRPRYRYGMVLSMMLKMRVRKGFEVAFLAWERHIANFLKTHYEGFVQETVIRPSPGDTNDDRYALHACQ